MSDEDIQFGRLRPVESRYGYSPAVFLWLHDGNEIKLFRQA